MIPFLTFLMAGVQSMQMVYRYNYDYHSYLSKPCREWQ
eukprot:COSAG05_NODE_78_length_21399_cov_26.298216_10_plen_38_part_00